MRTISKLHRLVLVVALLTAGGALSGASAGKKGEQNMIRIELNATQPVYAPGESVELRMRVVNDGDAPIDLPHPNRVTSEQPIYTITGPDFPAGKSLSQLSAARARDYPLEAARTVTLRVDPHSSWEEVINLANLVSATLPGAYQLSCRYEMQGKAIQSNAAGFRIASFLPRELMIGQGVRPFGAGFGSGIFAMGDGPHDALYSLELREQRTDLGEAEISIRRRLSVPAVARDFTVADKNFPYKAEIADWAVWREGPRLEFLSTYLQTPVSFDLGQDLAYLVKPALKTLNGPLEVLSVSKDESELLLASISHSKFGEAKDFAVRWRTKLPARPVQILAAIAPDPQQSTRHLALVSETKSGIEVHHAWFTESAAPSGFQGTPIDGVRVLPDLLPSLFVDPVTGHAYFSALVLGPGKAASSVLDAEWDDRGQLVKKPALLELRSLPAQIHAGRVLVTREKRGGIDRRAILVGQKNELFKMNGAGEIAPLTFKTKPTHPVVFLPGDKLDYLLTADPARGLRAEPIHR